MASTHHHVTHFQIWASLCGTFLLDFVTLMILNGFSLSLLCLMLISAAFGDPHRGREMGKAAELIVAKPGMSRTKSRTIFKVHGFIYHWTSSLQATLDPLLEGYRIGLEIGDNQCAGWCCE